MRRILLIEDDATSAALAMRLLRQEGMTCVHAETFAEGLTAAQGSQFDCAIVDGGLPDKDLASEYDTVSRLKELGCPIVFYTGSGDPNLIEAVRATGAAFVEKPGVKMLIEKVYSQMNFAHPDHESLVGQQNAQRRIGQSADAGFYGFTAKKGPALLLLIALLSTTGGFSMWLFHLITDEAKDAEKTKTRFELIERRMDAREKAGEAIEGSITVIRQQNQISIDDRANLRDAQREIKKDIMDRLDRIENKIDRKPNAFFGPPSPNVATVK